MGMWIAIIIALFVFGSMMALKPSGVDQRLDKLRITARQLQLNPKLVPCPDWVVGRDNEYGRGMMGQYALVLPDMKLPQTRYRAIDGQWRVDSSFIESDDKSVKLNIPSVIRSHNGHNNSQRLAKADFSLDKTPLKLPSTIEPFVKGLMTKANSIVIYWEDIAYVRPSSNPSYKSKAIEADLAELKTQLENWALKIQNAQKSSAVKIDSY